MSIQTINRASRSRRLRRGIALAAVLAAQQWDISKSLATTRSWVGPVGGDWNTALSWGPTGVPISGDTALITTLAGTTVNFTTNDYSSGSLVSLYLASTSSLIINTLQQSGGVMRAVTENIGDGGASRYIQSGGTNSVSGILYIAQGFGSNGTYQISGGTLISSFVLELGNHGFGTFLQSAGQVKNLSALDIGELSDGAGYYGLSGGSFISTYDNIGLNGSGTFVQTGGIHVASSEVLGYGSTSTGTYNHSAGSNAVSRLFLGYSAGAVGTYNLSGSGSLIVAPQYADESYMSLGENGGQGIFNQIGGTGSISTTLRVGKGNGSSGRYDLSGGAMSVGGDMWVGDHGSGVLNISGTGALNIGGALHVADQGSGSVNITGGAMTVGSGIIMGEAFGGTITISSGLLNVTGTEQIGAHTAGRVTQTGGTHNVTGALRMSTAGGGNGLYLLSDGTLRVSGFEIVGETRSATFLQSGGTHIVGAPDSSQRLTVGLDFSSQYALSGGTLTVFGIEALSNGGVSQGGGTHRIESEIAGIFGGTLIVGSDALRSGYYTMGAGTLAVAASEVIGSSGTGSFYQSGGVHTIGLPATPGSLYVGYINPGSLDLTASASLTVNGFAWIGGNNDATLSIYGGAMTVTGSLNIGFSPNARINLSGGALSAASLQLWGTDPSQFNWTGGTLSITGSDGLTVGQFWDIGTSLFMDSNRHLNVTNTLSIDNGGLVTLADGNLSVGSLNTGGVSSRFNWTRGELVITGPAGLNFTSGGLLGSTFVAVADRPLTVTNTATLSAGGVLVLNDQAIVTAGAMVNNGQVQLTSLTSQLNGGTLINNGLVIGTGHIGQSLLNNSSGIVRVTGSDLLGFSGSSNVNNGQINLLGGIVEFTHAVTNGATGMISGRGLFSAGDSGLNNNGTIVLSGGFSDFHGDVANNSDAQITISGQANVTFWDDVSNNPGGSIKVSSDAVATFFGTYAGGGITGGGNTYFEADLSPGFSPAAISIDGKVNLGPQSKLKIELAGKTRGAQYDAVDITGVASLDGKVSVSTLGGFTPLPGDTFNILTFASRSGDVTVEAQMPFTGLRFQKVYSATALQLLASALYDGDANLDGLVDIRDLYALASHYNAGGQIWTSGDFTHDGIVNAVDLGILATNWQAGVGSPLAGETFGAALSSLGLPALAVPEPGPLVLLGAGFVSLLRRRRRLR